MLLASRARLAVISAVVAIVPVSLLASPASANAASNNLAPPPIASGAVTNAHGQADPHGEVYVLAWPDQAELAAAHSGAQLPLTLVGFARTNAQGRYAVQAQSASLMTTNGRQGFVNLQVIVVSGGKEATSFLSVTNSGTGWRVKGSANAAASLSFNFASHTATATPVATLAPVTPTATGFAATKPAAATAGTAAATPALMPITPMTPTAALQRLREATNLASASAPGSLTLWNPGGCLIIPGTIYYDLKEHYLTTETYGGSIPETVTEGTNSSTSATLGIAYSATGGTPWSANGTASISASLSHSVSAAWSAPHTVYNRVNYRNFSNTCGGTNREPIGFYDFLTNDGVNVGITWQYNCGSHNAGTNWGTGSATSATIGGGVSLGILSVSAQAGFGSSVHLNFHYNVNGEICGNNSAGPLSSSLLEADPF